MRTSRVLLLCGLLVGFVLPLNAQEQLTRAVLLSGPTAVKSIPVYAANRIPAFEGLYVLEEGNRTEAGELRVLYTQEDLYIPPGPIFLF